VLLERTVTFVDRLQHADSSVFDGHRHAEQTLYFKFDPIRHKGVVARILGHIIENDMLVCAEDGPGQAVVERDGDLCQPRGVRAGSRSKVETRIFFVVQQDGGAFTVQQLGRRGSDQLEQRVEIQRRIQNDT
jgi:hypothetical protein